MVKRFSASPLSTRQVRVSEFIQKKLSNMILHQEISNLDSLDVSISSVNISSDLKQASIYIAPFLKTSNIKKKSIIDIINCLNKAKGYIRMKLAQEYTGKFCPDIHFFEDIATQNASEFDKILLKIRAY